MSISGKYLLYTFNSILNEEEAASSFYFFRKNLSLLFSWGYLERL